MNFFYSRRILVILSSVLALTISHWQSFLIFGITHDEIYFLQNKMLPVQFLEIGRFTSALLLIILQPFGGDLITAHTINTVIMIVSMSVFFSEVCKYWKIYEFLPLNDVLLVVLLLVCHPFYSEWFIYRNSHLYNYGIAFILQTIAFRYINKSRTGDIIFIILTCFALGAYQPILPLIYGVFLIEFVFTAIIGNNSGRFIDYNGLKKLIYNSIILLISIALFYLIFKITIYIFGLSVENRTGLIAFSQLGVRVSKIFELLKIMLFSGNSNPLFNVYLTSVSWTMVFLGILFYTKIKCKSYSLIKNILLLLSIIFLIFLLIINSIGTQWVVLGWWPQPRILVGISFLWCMAIIFYLKYYQGKCITLKYVLPFLIIYVYMSISNNIHINQYRSNVRDERLASAIINRIELDAQSAPIKRIAIIGRPWSFQLLFNTTYGDITRSNFHTNYACLNLLREISGYDWNPPNAKDNKIVKNNITTMKPWPDDDSIRLYGDLAIVYLPDEF